MSQIYKNKNIYENKANKNNDNINIIRKLGNITQYEAKKLAKAIICLDDCKALKDILLYNTDDDLKDIDQNLLLFMLFYFCNEYNTSKKHLDIFLENKNANYIYYFAISEYINLKHIKKSMKLK